MSCKHPPGGGWTLRLATYQGPIVPLLTRFNRGPERGYRASTAGQRRGQHGLTAKTQIVYFTIVYFYYTAVLDATSNEEMNLSHRGQRVEVKGSGRLASVIWSVGLQCISSQATSDSMSTAELLCQVDYHSFMPSSFLLSKSPYLPEAMTFVLFGSMFIVPKAVSTPVFRMEW